MEEGMRKICGFFVIVILPIIMFISAIRYLFKI